MKAQELNISQIELDSSTQFRVDIDEGKVAEYAQLMTDGVELPPIRVIADGSKTYLVDGWHRLYAHKKLEKTAIMAELTVGTYRDAVLAALSANNDHGLPTTNQDKRKKVLFALRDPDLSQLSQREIARLCGVTQAMVSKVKNEIALPKSDNGYQLDDPAQVLGLLKKNPDIKTAFLTMILLNHNPSYAEKKVLKRLMQLGIVDDYGDYKRRWTPMANLVANLCIPDDPWVKLEYELTQKNRELPRDQQAHVSNLGQLKSIIEKLLGVGWVEVDDLGGGRWGWPKMLCHAGYVLEHVVEYEMDNGYGHQWKARNIYYHLTEQGQALIGGEFPGIAPHITREDIEAEQAAEKERREAARQKANEALEAITGDDDEDDSDERQYVIDELENVEYNIRETLPPEVIDACLPHLEAIRAAIQPVTEETSE